MRKQISNTSSVTKPRNRKNSPDAISDLLSSSLESFRLSKKVQEYSAFPFWPEVVGEKIAAVAKPEKIIRGKILVVRVIDAAWAQELSLMKKEFLERLLALERGAIIEDIKFVTGNPKSL